MSWIKNKYLVSLILVNIATMTWAGNMVVGRILSESLSPLLTTSLRFSIGSILFVGLLFVLKRSSMVTQLFLVAKEDWLRFFLMSLFGIIGFPFLLYFGLQFSEATNAAVINGSAPIFALAVTRIFELKPIGRRLGISSLIAFAGVIVLVLGLNPFKTGFQMNIGDIAFVGAVVSWVIFSMLSKKHSEKYDRLFISAVPCVLSLPILWFFTGMQSQNLVAESLSTEVILGILYIGVFPTIIGLYCWNYSLSVLGTRRSMLFYNLLPVYGVAFSYLFLGEKLGVQHLVGALLVVVSGLLISKEKESTMSGVTKFTKAAAILMLGLFAFGPSALQASTAEARRFLILHSYSKDFAFTQQVHQGILGSLENEKRAGRNWQVRAFYMDGKRKNSAQEVSEAKAEGLSLIDSFKPHAIMTTDDLAFKTFYPEIKKRGIPLTFSGINGKLSEYGYQEGESGVTGSLESFNIPAVVKMMKRLRPSLEEFIIISDNNITGKALSNYFKEQISEDKQLARVELTQVYGPSYPRLKHRLKQADPQKTGIVVAAAYSFKEGDRFVSYEEIDLWISENTRLIDSGIIAFHMKGKAGRLLGLAASATEMGAYSSRLIFEAFEKNIDPAQLRVRRYLPLEVRINKERAKKLNIEIPIEILSYAKSANEILKDPKE